MLLHVPSPEFLSPIEQMGKFVLRPHLQLSYTGPRKTETVSVQYATAQYHPISSPGSTATVTLHGGGGAGQSRYVRVWVHNSWGFPAHRVEVYVERISLDGQLVEPERSPLHWMDFKDTFEYPKPMPRGDRNGWYVDVCAADSVDPRLQILTMKGVVRGYHRFEKPGTYKIELSAEAAKPCKFDTMKLTVRHDGKHWDKLAIVSAAR
jgi:hypothetical protein